MSDGIVMEIPRLLFAAVFGHALAMIDLNAAANRR
jgi:hypothetical protein